MNLIEEILKFGYKEIKYNEFKEGFFIYEYKKIASYPIEVLYFKAKDTNQIIYSTQNLFSLSTKHNFFTGNSDGYTIIVPNVVLYFQNANIESLLNKNEEKTFTLNEIRKHSNFKEPFYTDFELLFENHLTKTITRKKWTYPRRVYCFYDNSCWDYTALDNSGNSFYELTEEDISANDWYFFKEKKE